MNLTRFRSRAVRSAALALACTATALTAAGCRSEGRDAAAASAETAEHRPSRGDVVSTTPLLHQNAGQIAARLTEAGIDPAQAHRGARAYRVVYRAADNAGKPTTASELVAVPDGAGRTLPTVSWLHGTQVYKGDTASVNDGSTDRAAALLFASAGYAVSAPDYIGLGTGPGIHPYGGARATVNASVDALRAARTVLRRRGHETDRTVMVAGFSQGGPATMLVGRALQEGADRYFRPGALAPVSGPYDLSAFEAGAADDKVAKSSLYLACFATAWNRMYGLYDSPGEAFRPAYAPEIETLFDGTHQAPELMKKLPPTSKALFTPEFLNRVRHPTGVLQQKLDEMDSTCAWRPTVPVHLFHARGDQDVAFENSVDCRDQLAARGAAPAFTDVGNHDHSTTVLKALPQIVRGFDRVR